MADVVALNASLRDSVAVDVVSDDDRTVVAHQLGRRPRAISSIATRCLHGFPAVVECLPSDTEGHPFPTLFYCTCPTLVAAVSALESACGVRSWTRRLEQSPLLSRSLADAAAESVRRRQVLVRRHDLTLLDGGASIATGVGGVADATSVKCLHAHVAHALACPGYEFGEAVMAEVRDPWCQDHRCRLALPTADEG